MQFEWNINKAETNIEKHKISFVEAETVFGDPLAKIFDDEEHSFEEKREIIVGHSIQNRLLIISFTERENDTVRNYQREINHCARKKGLRKCRIKK